MRDGERSRILEYTPHHHVSQVTCRAWVNVLQWTVV
jgi:hypothetical protein